MGLRLNKKILLPIVFGLAGITFLSCTYNEKLVIEVCDISKEYDGIEIKANEYKILSGSINKKHHIECYFDDKSYVDVGEYISTAEIKIFNQKNEDVTSKYNLEVLDGYIDIFKRQITYTIEDKDYVYDGNQIELEEGKVTSGSLALDHSISITLSKNCELVHVTSNIYENSKISVKDSKNNDVSRNYEIEYVKGMVNIIPRNIEIKPENISKEYDGLITNPSNYQIVKGSLVNNDSFDLTYGLVNQVDVCSNIITKIEGYKVVDTKGNDVSKDYNVTLKTGYLSILKKQLTIKTFSSSKEYDGEELKDIRYEVEGLKNNDKIDASNVSYNSITEPGSLNNVHSNYKVVNDNNEDVTDNYSIKYEYGKLKVDKAIINVVGKSYSWVYDGKVHSLSNDNLPESFTGNVETIYVRYIAEITDVGSVENTISQVYINGKASIGSKYYDIVITNGTLSITKNKIIVTLKDITKVYDGNSFEDDLKKDLSLYEAISSYTTLPEGLSLSYNKENYSFKKEYEICSKPYTIDVILKNAEQIDVTNSFTIEVISANYSIIKADYDMSSIKWEDINATYDGNEHEVTIKSIPNGLSVKSYSNNKYIDAGEYFANATFVYDSDHYNEPKIDDYKWEIKKANNIISEFNVSNYNIEEYKTPTIKATYVEDGVSYLYSLDNVNYTDTIPSVPGYYYVKAFIADSTNYNYAYSEVKNIYVTITDTLLSKSSSLDVLINTLNQNNFTLDITNLVFTNNTLTSTISNLKISYNYNDSNKYFISSLTVNSKAIKGINNSIYDIDIIIYNNKIYTKVNETNNSYLIGIDYYIDYVDSYLSSSKTDVYYILSTILNVSLDTIKQYFRRIIPIIHYYSSLSRNEATNNLISRGFKLNGSNYELDIDKLIDTNEQMYSIETSNNTTTYGSYLKYVDNLYESKYGYSNASKSVYQYITNYFAYTLQEAANKLLTNTGVNMYDYLKIADDVANRYSPYHDFVGILGKIKDSHYSLTEIANQYPTYRICDLVGLALNMDVPVSSIVKVAMKSTLTDMYRALEKETAYDSFSDSEAEAYDTYSFAKQIYNNHKLSTTATLIINDNVVSSIEINMDNFKLDNSVRVSGTLNFTLDQEVNDKYNRILKTIMMKA